MKKIILFIICFISFSPVTKAFLGEDLGINLYNSIDEGIEELELKQYEYELAGQGESIKDNLNEILKKEGFGECIDKDVNSSDIEKISNGNIGILSEILNNKCKSENNSSITQDDIIKIQNIIKDIHDISKNSAQEKTSKINEISRIGIYSDGNRDNSTFDLVSDLQDIDQIIFTTKIEYEGEEYENADEILKNLFDKTKSTSSSIQGNKPLFNNEVNPQNKFESNLENQKEDNNDIDENLDNNQNNDNICEEDSNKSGLSQEAFNNIISSIENIKKPIDISNKTTIDENKPQNSNGLDEDDSGIINAGDISGSNYKAVNDNAVWPCTDFFCISIELITYNHKLLGGGPNISIEYLLNRSNSHLKKFAGTSLIQSKMTTNNFELGLRNISLPDLFHIGFVIQKKPVPILSIKKDESKKDGGKYSKNNLLEEYYKNKGLDYSRRNDLSIFKAKEKKLKTILDSADLTNKKFTEKLDQLNNIMTDNIKQDDVTKKSVYNKVLNDELGDFGNQFIELRKFSHSIFDYVKSIDGIIRLMDSDIPVDG